MLANGREQKKPQGRKPNPSLFLDCATLAEKAHQPCSDWRSCRAKHGQWIGKSCHEVWKNQLMLGIGKQEILWFTSSRWGHLADGKLCGMCWHCSKLLCCWRWGERWLVLKIWKKERTCLFSWVPLGFCWLLESHAALPGAPGDMLLSWWSSRGHFFGIGYIKQCPVCGFIAAVSCRVQMRLGCFFWGGAQYSESICSNRPRKTIFKISTQRTCTLHSSPHLLLSTLD